jgi:hypothetical protein
MPIQRTALLIAITAALAACGPAVSVSTASTSGPRTPTASPAPARASFVPLLVAFAFNGVGLDPGMLMLASGAITGRLPSGPIVGGDSTLTIAGPFGARMIGTDGQQIGSSGPVSIVAVSTDGALTTLDANVSGSPSVAGRDDGKAWAWVVQTLRPACGSSSRASFDVYTDDGSGAKKIGSASFNAGVTLVSLTSWTSAGIVVSGVNACGPLGGSLLSISPALLIDPATGVAADLASRIGTDCNFNDIADDGTIACSVGGSAPAVRVIAPDGIRTNYTISSLTSQQCDGGETQLSADAKFAAISLACGEASNAEILMLDLASGHRTVVTEGPHLAPTLWTPEDALIASDDHGTYSIASSGVATLINATYDAQARLG